MSQDHDGMLAPAMKVCALMIAWLASWKVGELQALAGAISFSAVAVGAALNAYVVWRDKIRPGRKPRKPSP